MSIYYITALTVGLIWACTALVSVTPARHLGALRFNMLRMITVSILLAVAATIQGGWHSLSMDIAPALVLSGFAGIFLGDTALFAALRRLGPRRTPVIFATNAPLVALMGWLWLGETLQADVILGIITVFGGVVLAILYGQRKQQQHDLETVRGRLWVGVGLAFIAAIFQASGLLLARPIMEQGADPVAASAVRVGIAALVLMLVNGLHHHPDGGENTGHSAMRILLQTALSGIIGMGIGMTLILFALQGGDTGIVATLSATSPVWILPLVWFKTRQRPSIGAFAGAILVVIGCGLIFGAFN